MSQNLKNNLHCNFVRYDRQEEYINETDFGQRMCARGTKHANDLMLMKK